MLVAKCWLPRPPRPSASDDDLIVGTHEVVDLLAGDVVEEDRADGDFEDSVLARDAGTVGAEAVASALRFVLGVEAEVDEGVVAERGFHQDVAAVASGRRPRGPPRGTNFSRRKAMQPLPPSPALTRIRASSMNIALIRV